MKTTAGEARGPQMARKNEIVTFKVDESLKDAMKGVKNRSEFIRAAILSALDSVCPLCGGTGILTPNQKSHWNALAADHVMRECGDCHEQYLVCPHKAKAAAHRGKRA